MVFGLANRFGAEAIFRKPQRKLFVTALKTSACKRYGADIMTAIKNRKERKKKIGFVYHHTCNDVPVPLMNEVRVGHTNVMTKVRWQEIQAKSSEKRAEKEG